MNIKSQIKSFLPEPIISFFRVCKDYRPSEVKKDLSARKDIEKVRKKKHTNSKIKVAFIAQMSEIWDKESPIYETMLSDPAFDPFLIAVPPCYNPENSTTNTEYGESNYFLEKYPECVRAYDNGGWISLKDFNFDYAFLQRPYDHYLPDGFRSSDLVHFTKVCYIPYGFVGADVFNGGNSDKTFFRNIYFSFLESEDMVEVLSKKFRTRTERENHKILNAGYPALIPYFTFDKTGNLHTLMWTPRWSFDPVIGGSNFLNYKDCFIDAVKMHPEFKFVFRPHPLMFGEILNKGFMTQLEIDDYIDSLETLGVVYDKNTPLVESLNNVDALITDFSTIIIQFFLTGRPIIYCESCIELNKTYQKMKKGMYVVKSKEDFVNSVTNLSCKGDSLKAIRDEIISDGFGQHLDSINTIINAIKKDYKES